ncbi:MAG: hypothetical protein ACJA1A_000250 [Saprospiraceae bacterium]|jgi:hypothetical protein
MPDYLIVPQWSSTRSIYRKLSKEMHVLTDAYRLEVNERTILMMDHLILAIDEVDKAVDELPTKVERDDITLSILNFLLNSDEKLIHKLASQSLSSKMLMLKKIVIELEITDRFHKAVSDIFDYTERKRHTQNETELIGMIMLEGKATAELPLSIMKIESTHAFGQFFNNLCKLMGIADLVIDAKSDYISNYISIKPRFLFYIKLNWILVKEGSKLIWKFPERIHFLVYCIKFSMVLLFAKD